MAEEQYSSMKFDVMSIKTDVFYAIPAFEKYKEFHAEIKLPLDKVIKYIGLMYDMGSPLVANIEDIREREKAAIIKVWNPHPPQELKSEVKKLCSCTDEVYNSMILRYLWLQGSLEYTTLAVLVQSHRRNLELLWHSKESLADEINDVDTKMKIEKAIPEQLERITELKRRIAAGDNRMVNLIADSESGIAEMKALQYKDEIPQA